MRKTLSAADVGLVASLGIPEIEVYKKLVLDIFLLEMNSEVLARIG